MVTLEFSGKLIIYVSQGSLRLTASVVQRCCLFHCKCKSRNLLTDLAVASAQGHFLFTCYLFALLFLFSRSSDIPRVGPVEAGAPGLGARAEPEPAVLSALTSIFP